MIKQHMAQHVVVLIPGKSEKVRGTYSLCIILCSISFVVVVVQYYHYSVFYAALLKMSTFILKIILH